MISASEWVAELRQRFNAEPFQAFEIVLSHGRVFPVTRPDHLAFTRRMVAVALADGTIDVGDLRHTEALRPMKKPRTRRDKSR